MRFAVFTGAGISGAAPAALPMGNRLRDAVLAVMHGAANRSAPDLVASDRLTELTGSGKKLEVVVGRLWGTVGTDALGCLLSLRTHLPNEAHLLCALHLLRGGTHVTLNFDLGVELAHALLTGRSDLPQDAPDSLRQALPAWRALTPPDSEPLRVAASNEEFHQLVRDGQPPALLKVHGSLNADQDALVDVVVVDNEELGALTATRHQAVTGLGSADELLVTGYAGADPDVYGVLLDTAEGTTTTWACFSLAANSPVPDDCQQRGIRLIQGAPYGLATTALRRALDLPPDEPRWPEVTTDPMSWEQRFADWGRSLRNRHPDTHLALAWAWLTADGGDLDAAIAQVRRLAERRPDNLVQLRLADILYTRASPADRTEANAIYRRLVATRGTDHRTRNHCLIRSAGIARGLAMTPGPVSRRLRSAAWANAAPFAVIALGRFGQDPEATGIALGALQQTWLRALEAAGTVAPPSARPLLAALSRLTARLGEPAARRTQNGNARALARTHRLTLLALADLYDQCTPEPALPRELVALRDTYINADDPPGAGNCTVALALCEAASGWHDRALRLLKTARDLYAEGRPDGQPIAAGASLLQRAQKLVDQARNLDHKTDPTPTPRLS